MSDCDTLSNRVEETLKRSHPAFRTLNVREEKGAIVLGGLLPSFYLKQIVQTVAFEIDGVERLDNQIEVVRASSQLA